MHKTVVVLINELVSSNFHTNFNYHICLRHHLGDGQPISTLRLMAIGVGVCQFGIRAWLDVMYLHPMMPVIVLMI